MAQNLTPLEDKEQKQFVHWLNERGLKEKFTCTLQDAPLGLKYINKYKAMGLNGGLPDMIICIESHLAKDGKPHLVFIEMKRTQGGRESKKQKWWREFINSVNGDVSSYVAIGRDEAVEIIDGYLKPREVDLRPLEEQEWFINQ